MSEVPSLAVDRTVLLRELGRHLGWPRDPSFWDERQQADGDDILRRALTQAYYPAPISDERQSHVWSFLWPVTIIQTKTGESDVDLPDDFGGMTDDIRYVNNDGASRIKKVTVNEMLDRRRLNVDTTGYPSRYAIAPRRAEGFVQQRYVLMLDPTPQAEYELRIRYKSDPLAIGDSFPYPLGGQMFADVLTSSVVAAAEDVLNDVHQGPLWDVFVQKLRTAIYLDRQEHYTGNLGYNGDGPADLLAERRDVSFTINGVTPGEVPFYFAS